MALLALFAIIRSFLSISVSTNTLKKLISWSKIAIAFTFIELVFTENYTLAQIIPDETLGNESSVLTPDVNIQDSEVDRIDGGAKRGTNLFHSFREFNVGENQKIYFTNPTGIKNIFSRVTGTNISNIRGTLGVNGIANLFLINPNGIIFGANASLDLKGSFLVSTADAVKFADGISFSATNPSERSLLSINVPIGLQLPANPQALSIEDSNLAVNSSNTLAFVGGEVKLDGGTISNPGGKVELGGLATEGTVRLNNVEENLSLTFPEGIARADLSLDKEAKVDVSDAGGGSITIHAKNMLLAGKSGLQGGIAKNQDSEDRQAGNILIDATGVITITDKSFLFNKMEGTAGNAGNINITTGSLYLINGSDVVTQTKGKGNAGDVIINARELVSIDGENSEGEAGIFTNIQPTEAKEQELVGNAGNIEIVTNSLYLKNGARLTTANVSGKGNAGDVIIQARELVSLDGENTQEQTFSAVVTSLTIGKDRTTQENLAIPLGNAGKIGITTNSLSLSHGARLVASVNGEGNAGDISIATNSLSLTDGARIETATGGKGNSGEVTINALEQVELSGVVPNSSNADLKRPGGIFTTVNETATGNAGNIKITTNFLSISGGAKLETLTRGTGNAGNVIIDARDIFLDGVVLQPDGENSLPSSIATSVQQNANGNGGNIFINTNSLKLTNGALFTASTRGDGKGGNIFINADNISVDGFGINNVSSGIYSSVDKPQDTTKTATGQGGRIVINSNSISLSNSALLSTGTFDRGNAGDIEIQAKNIEITKGAQILTTTAASSGNAGNITINTNGGNITLIGSDPNLKKRNSNLAPNILKNQGEASGLFANTAGVPVDDKGEPIKDDDGRQIPASTGRGGNISIETGQMTIQNGAKITASSEGNGNAGNILKITANNLILDNGSITTKSQSGRGGNINNLQVKNFLILRDRSEISTTAGTGTSGGGDGGYINISADFIIASPSANSDISANAVRGNGGNVTINARGILGIYPQEKNTPESDITASSELGIDGTVSINSTTIDPNQGLIVLPEKIVDASALITTSCGVNEENSAGQFSMTGRGGLPTNPNEVLSSQDLWEDLRSENFDNKVRSQLNPAPQQIDRPLATIAEATGWNVSKNGKVTLVATNSNANAKNISHSCRTAIGQKSKVKSQ